MVIFHENNMIRNVRQILGEDYVIPFYQRNYNWGITEIRQFIQDVYESYKNNKNKNYYIGSLVVFKQNKEHGFYEVIDGQQRLTTIHLIARLLTTDSSGFRFLQYDSRKEVEAFFKRITIEQDKIYKRKEDEDLSNLDSFFAATNSILNEKLQSEIDSTESIASLKESNRLESFETYFFNKVILVKVEMPSDTDVANYFEIMNNRGRQLQEHEILKALLMANITKPKDKMIFGNVWDACSQMDRPIHKFFNAEQRTLIFGESYDTVNPKKIHQLKYDNAKVESYSVLDILSDKASKTLKSTQEENEEEVDEEIDYTSTIDFTNFLIHVLKLTYTNSEIPLSSDKLLKIYKSIPKVLVEKVSPLEFIEKLFFYRVVFDRFIVKSEVGSENADQYDGIGDQFANTSFKARWMLVKPVIYWKNTRRRGKKYPSLNFKNTFENKMYQDRAVKLLSMLQVTYRQRKNKNYLQFILGLFDPDRPKTIDLSAIDFIHKVEDFALAQFEKLELIEYLDPTNKILTEFNVYAYGTNTPHFIFNFIDYLLWVDKVWNRQNHDINEVFDFTYRNSIEHHYPQALKEKLETRIINKKDIVLNSLGNLFLVGKNANSKLNDRTPLGKAADPRFNSNTLSPKRCLMYKITNDKKDWTEEEIIEHYKLIIAILEKRMEILLLQ